jgi:hypothetical protein
MIWQYHFGYVSKETEIRISEKYLHTMIIKVLVTTARMWKQVTCSSDFISTNLLLLCTMAYCHCHRPCKSVLGVRGVMSGL